MHRAVAREQYKLAAQGGEALRFHIEGKNLKTALWLFKSPGKKEVRRSLGPAQVILSNDLSISSLRKETKPTLLLHSGNKKNNMNIHYWLYHPSSEKITQGFLKVGSVLKTGWMDFQFRVLSYFPNALPDTQFIPQKRVKDNTVSAIELEFKNQRQWMGLNSHVFFFLRKIKYLSLRM